jgi:uncharacterized membrane protein YbhN (UPF0104 family)
LLLMARRSAWPSGGRSRLGRRPARGVAVVFASLAAMGVFAATHVNAAGATERALAGTQVAWLVALLGLAAAGPILHCGMLRAGQATVGARLRHREALRLAVGIHAANLAVRAAGAAGLGVLLAGDLECRIGRPARSAAYVLGREVAHWTVCALALVAVALLGADGHLSALVAGGATLFVLSRALHAVLLWCAATRPDALPRWRRLDRLRAHAPEFAAELRRAAAHPRRLAPVAAWAIAIDALHVGWLWVALQAVGAPTSIDVSVETYGVVALLGTVTILPAGLGPMDAGLVAALHHSGVALAAAAAGVLLFRIADLWVPLVAGAGPALAAARPAGD